MLKLRNFYGVSVKKVILLELIGADSASQHQFAFATPVQSHEGFHVSCTACLLRDSNLDLL